MSLLIGFGCALMTAPMYAREEDMFPRCAQIESVADAEQPVWAATTPRYARVTDLTLAQCWAIKNKNEKCTKGD